MDAFDTSGQVKSQVVRLAKLQIDSTQLKNYKAILKEEIETSMRVELGILTLYSVLEKNNPTHTSRSWKYMLPKMPSRLTWKRLISKNTRVPQKKWLSLLNSSRQFPLSWRKAAYIMLCYNSWIMDI